MIHDTLLRVGIIGAGNIAGAHIRGYLQAAKFARVSAVADVDAERAQRLAERVGNAQVFPDYRDMIASSLVDAVDICLPHHLHRDAIVAAAAAGKHILCEKPLCLTVEEAEAVTHAVAAAGITLMCAHNQLFLPPVATAREMISQGKLGKVYAARTTDSFFAPGGDATAFGWRARRATSGGGELIDTGYHPTYLLLHLEFADATVGNIVTSWAYEPAGCTEKFSIVGEAGSLWSDGLSLFYKPRAGDQVVVQQSEVEPDTFVLEIADFISCLREGRRPLNNEVDGVNVLKVILAAYASADRRMVVEIKDL